MLEEAIKSLGPWPVLQLFLVILVFVAGGYAVFRGLISSRKDATSMVEDRRAEWEAYNQLQNIEQNSFKTVELLARLVDIQLQMRDTQNKAIEILWNRRQN